MATTATGVPMPNNDQPQNTAPRLPIRLPLSEVREPKPDPLALFSPADRQARDNAMMRRTLEAFGLPETLPARSNSV